jgi:hypothetical protein
LPKAKPLAGIEVYHVPGHCPGQVCLQVDDILLTADHVLAYTTPHQAPESITSNTGPGPLSAVPGAHPPSRRHPACPWRSRSADRRSARPHRRYPRLHEERLGRVLELTGTPRSIAAISKELFGTVESYHVLLALEETGAHVEYLYQRGELTVANLDAVEQEENPVILYQRVRR